MLLSARTECVGQYQQFNLLSFLRRMTMKMLSRVMLVLAFLLSASVSAQTTSQLRVAHLSPDAPAVDIWVDGNRVLQNVAFKGVSNYLSLPAGSYRIQVSPAGAATPIVIDATVTLEAGKAYTAAATGLLGANDLKPLVLVDDLTLDPAKAKVRFVHTSPDAPAVDIAVKGGPVLFSNVEFREASDYLNSIRKHKSLSRFGPIQM
jgi:hypothetical protein